MINIKSEREIDLMREAGRLTAMIHEAVRDAIKPGVTTEYLDQIVKKVVDDNNVTASFHGLYDFPGYACMSVNDEVIHGIPGKRVLEEGDIVSIDGGACYQGYHGDSAWTYPVGEVSEEAQRLMDVTKESLFKGLEQVKPGKRLGDVGHAIESHLNKHGYTTPREYTGHGIGNSVHEEPYVPNYGEPNTGVMLKEGMTLAIEPMAYDASATTEVLDDDWTVVTDTGVLAAHFEHTIVVTKDGYEILTKNLKEDHTPNE